MRIQSAARKRKRPVRVIQFGQGNLLRGLVDAMIDIANERGHFDGSVAIIKPTARGNLQAFEAQDCLYTVLERGTMDGRTIDAHRLVTAIDSACNPYEQPDCLAQLAQIDTARFIVSNTTEAGIVLDEDDRLEFEPPRSFPGKLTKLLYARYRHVQGDPARGFLILPTELIDENGRALRACVLRLAALWRLEAGFVGWLDAACTFACTLVDRIVSGYPAAEAPALATRLGYADALMTVCEPYALWAIECEAPEVWEKRFPLGAAGCPVVFTRDLRPYRERKVRLLNGAHTATALAAFLCGKRFVRELFASPALRQFLHRAMDEELARTLPMPLAEALAFTKAVRERFANPFLDHELLAIAMYSVSKWRARILPGVKEFLRATGRLPACLTFSMAALIAFYAGGREGAAAEIRDERAVHDFLAAHAALRAQDEAAFARAFLAQAPFWGEDLTRVPGFSDAVCDALADIRARGMERAILTLLEA